MNRFLIFVLATASLSSIASCSSDSSGSATNTVAVAADSSAVHAGGHTYACPMHPEVISTKEGEKCPKCGMALVHNDQVSNGKTCQMQFVHQPTQFVAGLDNYLGALGHVVVISEDTERYLHVHPNDQADKGPNIGFNTNFEKSGLYRVFLRFNHAGTIHTGNFTINVKV